MTDLDDKLQDILLSRTLGQYMNDADGNIVPVKWEDSPVMAQYIAEIKQAFVVAGYVNDAALTKLFADFERMTSEAKATLENLKTKQRYIYTGKDELERVMTGQEWYDTFFDTLGKQAMGEAYTDEIPYTGCSCDAIEAAKKAAGLE